MLKFENETGRFNSITRNDTVVVFYKKLDIFGFLSAYIITKWFEKHGMQHKLHLIPIVHDKDMYVDTVKRYTDLKDSIMFFIDTDFSIVTAAHYGYVARQMHIFDNKESVKALIGRESIMPGQNITQKLTFYNKSTMSILKVVYYAFMTDDYPDAFQVLEKFSHDRFTDALTDFEIRLPELYGSTFESVDEFLEQEKDKVFYYLKDEKSIIGHYLTQGLLVCYKNSSGYKYKNYSALVVNTAISTSLFITAMMLTCDETDFAICYEYVDGKYNYKIMSKKDDINLLEIFKNKRPHGYKNHVWFTRKENILKEMKEVA